MSVAIDNDFFAKFEASGLLDEALGLLGTTRDRCVRVGTLPHTLRGRKFRAQWGDAICEELIKSSQLIPAVPEVDPEALSRMALGPEGIDPGEAHLIAHVCASEAMFFATHDKRCLRTVTKVEGLVPSLKGRVVLVEQACWMLCEKLGVDVVRGRLAPTLARDNALRAIFASARDDGVYDGLRSYLEDAKRNSAPSIFWG